MHFKLEKTCGACPEQYNVFYGEEYVGFLHLRNGLYSICDPNDNVITVMYPNGDGIFESEERDKYIQLGLLNIVENLSSEDISYEIIDSL